MLVCWLLLLHVRNIPSDAMTKLSSGCWLSDALSNLLTDLTKLTCKRRLSNGLIYLIVNGLLSDILPKPLTKLTSNCCLSDFLPDLLTNSTSGCWLRDIFPEIVTNLTGGWWQMFGDRRLLLRAEL